MFVHVFLGGRLPRVSGACVILVVMYKLLLLLLFYVLYVIVVILVLVVAFYALELVCLGGVPRGG